MLDMIFDAYEVSKNGEVTTLNGIVYAEKEWELIAEMTLTEDTVDIFNIVVPDKNEYIILINNASSYTSPIRVALRTDNVQRFSMQIGNTSIPLFCKISRIGTNFVCIQSNGNSNKGMYDGKVTSLRVLTDNSNVPIASGAIISVYAR